MAKVLDNYYEPELPEIGQPDQDQRYRVGMSSDESVFDVEIPFYGTYKATVVAHTAAQAIRAAETFVKTAPSSVDICCGHIEEVNIG